MSDSFFDSNVVLYLVGSDRVKAIRAEELIKKGGIITVQVLNEIANVLRRKDSMPWLRLNRFIADIRASLDVRPVTIDIHDSGLRLAERYGFSIYDSFIVAAALAGDCNTLWSEDMQDGMMVDQRLRILNPFKAVA